MGAGSPGLLLERSAGQRAPAGDHGRELRCHCALRRNAPGEQPHRSLHGGARSRRVRDQAPGDLRLTDSAKPLMQQYNSAKQQVGNALLLFRVGDFYELFYNDAITAARELEITLTSRDKEKG